MLRRFVRVLVLPLCLLLAACHHDLSPQDVSTADLSSYDAIVLGIRTYSARPELARANARLLNYARAGGVVIVQYQSTEFNGNFTPYPFVLGGNGERVVEEDNKVTILAPKEAE